MPQNIELVCIIDDDAIYVNLVSKIIELKKLSKEILVFNNGKEAFDFFEERTTNNMMQEIPELILLDLNMPIMDGWEFLQEFTKLRPKIARPIELYVVSSSINPTDMERARAIQEVSDYIVKPIQLNDFDKIFSN